MLYNENNQKIVGTTHKRTYRLRRAQREVRCVLKSVNSIDTIELQRKTKQNIKERRKVKDVSWATESK